MQTAVQIADDSTRIALVGMDERSKKILSTTLALNFECDVVCPTHAQLIIFDTDRSSSQDSWKLLSTDNPVPVIALSDNAIDFPGVVCIKKPVAPALLYKSVSDILGGRHPKEVNKELRARYAEVKSINSRSILNAAVLVSETLKSDESLSNTWNIQEAWSFYDPSEYLQGFLHRTIDTCKTNGKIAKIQILGFELTIDPHNNWVHTNIPDVKLRSFGLLKTADISPIELDYVDGNTSYVENMSETTCLETFLWKLALFSSRGRLPKDMSIEETVRLKHWPNLTRLYRVENGARISALLVKNPTSLATAAKILNLPIEQICNFFCAAQAIGLAETAKDGDGQPKPVINQNPSRGLFSSIVKRLRNSI